MIYIKFVAVLIFIFAGLGFAEWVGNNFATPLSLLTLGGVIFFLIRSVIKDGSNK